MKSGLSLVLFVTFLSSFFCGASCYGGELTSREREVYYEVVHEKTYMFPWAPEESLREFVYPEIAKKYGVTVDQVSDIVWRAWENGPTKEEQKILNELESRLAALPQGATWKEEERVYREVADKYGLSIAILEDIETRMKDRT